MGLKWRSVSRRPSILMTLLFLLAAGVATALTETMSPSIIGTIRTPER